MKILICSHVFPPSVGGIETVSALLAAGFSAAGHEVTVITQTQSPVATGQYVVFSRPSIPALLKLGRSVDVILQSNISLATVLPLLLTGRPIVVIHHTWLSRTDGTIGWQDRLKRGLLHRFANVAVSKAIASSLGVEATIIGNPFEASEFRCNSAAQRNKDLVFMGRLVSDKGCDLIIRALAQLKREGNVVGLTVVGDGSERSALEHLVQSLGIESQVTFRGMVREGRGEILRQHKLLLIPSRWQEPFGLVALEGIAAGCVPIATDGGGLSEAVGPCGICIPRNDVGALAEAIRILNLDEALRAAYLQNSEKHIAQYAVEQVVELFCKLFSSLIAPDRYP